MVDVPQERALGDTSGGLCSQGDTLCWVYTWNSFTSGLGLFFQSLVLADTPTCDPEKFLPLTFSGAVFFHSGEAVVQPKTSKQFQPLFAQFYFLCFTCRQACIEASTTLILCGLSKIL